VKVGHTPEEIQRAAYGPPLTREEVEEIYKEWQEFFAEQVKN